MNIDCTPAMFVNFEVATGVQARAGQQPAGASDRAGVFGGVYVL